MKLFLSFLLLTVSVASFSQVTMYQNPGGWTRSLGEWTQSPAYPMEYLAQKSEQNLKTQKVAKAFIVSGVGLSLAGFFITDDPTAQAKFGATGGALATIGGLIVLRVNRRNTEITFALTHPIIVE